RQLSGRRGRRGNPCVDPDAVMVRRFPDREVPLDLAFRFHWLADNLFDDKRLRILAGEAGISVLRRQLEIAKQTHLKWIPRLTIAWSSRILRFLVSMLESLLIALQLECAQIRLEEAVRLQVSDLYMLWSVCRFDERAVLHLGRGKRIVIVLDAVFGN